MSAKCKPRNHDWAFRKEINYDDSGKRIVQICRNCNSKRMVNENGKKVSPRKGTIL